MRILLVEDDAMIGEVLAELLAECGHEVCGTATTETGAVAAAAHHAPDLMLVDVQLQPGSGISAMATILGQGAMPHVFMTGGARHGFPAGTTVLQKPFGRASLRAALEGIAAARSAALASEPSAKAAPASEASPDPRAR